MAGTLNANQIIPDQGQTLYINGIDYDANVVIGNTNTTIASFSPTGNVTVQGTITANGLISSTGNVNISGVTINSNGNMGIGTSTPAKSLHVASGSYSNSVRIESTGSIQSGVEFANDSSNTSSPPVVGSKGDAIFFENVNTERMRINAAGNVGIGSTSPSSLLHLKKRLGDAVSGPTATLSFGGNDAYSAAITGYQNNYEDRIGLGFYYYGSSGQQLGALLDTSGNFLIGKTSSTVTNASIQSNSGIYVDPSVATGGVQLKDRSVNINDNSTYTFNNYANAHFNILIKSNAGLSVVPVYPNGGVGVGFNYTYLKPGTATWTNAAGFSFSFTQAGTGGNTYTVGVSGGNGQITVQRTAGSLSYSIYIQAIALSE